jgi:CubicO group peptidase (beta-lactamase class C family)
VVIALLGVAPSLPAQVQLVAPDSVGFSADGLKLLQRTMRALVDDGKLAGVTTLVARHGKVVYLDAYGVQDLAIKKPVTKNTIFRIASMTKPIVGVAMMMLWEQGKWTLDDPVAKHIPEFADLKVGTPNGDVAQTTPMTMRQLMSHTAGFDVNAGYANANLRDSDLQAMIDRLAKLPLAVQPGSDWRYGPSVDIQGYIVEKLSGQSLDVFLRTKIFEPLGMKDTGFWVDASKVDRVTSLYTYGPDKRLVRATPPPGTVARPSDVGDPSSKPAFLSGNGGLLSTTDDYFRFAQMMLNGGEANGKRFLKASTVELMRTNVLREGVKVDPFTPLDGIGFGLGFAIVMDPAVASTPEGRNSFYWGGAYGTWFWIDPTNDLVVVGMMQNVAGSSPTGGSPPVRSLSRQLVYQALVNPEEVSQETSRPARLGRYPMSSPYCESRRRRRQRSVAIRPHNSPLSTVSVDATAILSFYFFFLFSFFLSSSFFFFPSYFSSGVAGFEVQARVGWFLRMIPCTLLITLAKPPPTISVKLHNAVSSTALTAASAAS